MPRNILITGAAGYIGGSLLADFIARKGGPISTASIYAAVRSTEQAKRLSKLDGVHVLQLELADQAAVRDAVLKNEIDIVIHLAGWASEISKCFIDALGERKEASGSQTCFVQSSVTALFSPEGGWTYGEIQDSDPTLFAKEKGADSQNIVRQSNIFVTDLAKERGVTSLIIDLPQVYGKGTGEWIKLSSQIPMQVRTSIKNKCVQKFDVENRPPAVHICDLVSLYAILTTKFLQNESIPSGEKGHYFAFNHRCPYPQMLDGIAAALYSRGLVDTPEVKIWPSDEIAAKSLCLPQTYIHAMCASTGEPVPVNGFELGWQPEWNEERFVAIIDDEVQAALDLDMGMTARYESLIADEK